MEARRKSGLCWLSAVQDETSDTLNPFICLEVRVGHEAIAKAWTQDFKALLAIHNTMNLHNIMHINETLGKVHPCCCLLIFIDLNEARAMGNIVTQDIPSLAVL